MIFSLVPDVVAVFHYGLCSKVTLGEYGSGLQRAEGWPAEQERIPIFYYYSFVEVIHVLIARVCVCSKHLHPPMQLITSHMSSHETGHDVGGQRRFTFFKSPLIKLLLYSARSKTTKDESQTASVL